MITIIADTLSAIWSFIQNIIDLVIWFVTEIGNIILMALSAMQFCLDFIFYLPPVLTVTLTAIITVMVIRRVRGD